MLSEMKNLENENYECAYLRFSICAHLREPIFFLNFSLADLRRFFLCVHLREMYFFFLADIYSRDLVTISLIVEVNSFVNAINSCVIS